MAGGERRREIKLARLLPDRLDNARAAMPGVHAPQRRETVEHLAAVGSRVVHVFRRHDELRRRLEARVVGERHPVVLEPWRSLRLRLHDSSSVRSDAVGAEMRNVNELQLWRVQSYIEHRS